MSHKEGPPEEGGNPQESWFLQLQRESWYLEMITSGVALFFVFQVPETISDAREHVAFHFTGRLPFLATGALIFLQSASYIVIGSLILHLVLRAFWIGMIGLNSVFPDGIVLDRLNLTPFFHQRLKRKLSDPRDWAQKIDNICSSFYGLTFFVLFLIVGFVSYIMVGVGGLFLLVIPLSYLPQAGAWTVIILYLVLYLLMGLLSLIDLLTLGGLKRKRFLSKLYYIPYRIMGVISLSFLIRPFYYLLISNLSKKKGVLLTLGMVLLIFGISMYTRVNNPYFPEHRPFAGITINGQSSSELYKDQKSYMNLRDSDIPNVAIGKDIYERNAGYLKVYIPLYGSLYPKIKSYCQEALDEAPLERGWRRSFFVMEEDGGFSIPGKDLDISDFRESWDCLNEMHRISVDDSLRDVELQFTQYPKKGEHKLVGHIPIRNLEPGDHRVFVERGFKTTTEEKKDTSGYYEVATIPFWIE